MVWKSDRLLVAKQRDAAVCGAPILEGFHKAGGHASGNGAGGSLVR